MAYYYPTPMDVVQDRELMAFLRQYIYQLEVLSFDQVPSNDLFSTPADEVSPEKAQLLYGWLISLFSNFMFIVTAGHEQVGAVSPYVQDVTFCAFRWTHGASIG